MIFSSIFLHPHKCYLFNVLTASIFFCISFLLCEKNCVAEIVVIVSSPTIELIEEPVIVNNLMNPSCTTHSDLEFYLGTSSLDKNLPIPYVWVEKHDVHLHTPWRNAMGFRKLIFSKTNPELWKSLPLIWRWPAFCCHLGGKFKPPSFPGLWGFNYWGLLPLWITNYGRFIYSLLFCQLWFSVVINYIQVLLFKFLNKIKLILKVKKQNSCCKARQLLNRFCSILWPFLQ